MNLPRVSVLIPTYKPNPTYLKEALQSLLSQTEQAWKAIICDEPTDANTEEIIQEFLQDERISYYKNAECLGIGGNWNRCAALAETPVFAYLFQDDLWHPEYLQTALNVLDKHPSVGFVSMGHHYQYEGEISNAHLYEKLHEFVQKNVAAGEHNGREFLQYWIERELHPNLVGEPPFVVLRQSLYETVGPFNEHMPQFLDVEYWLRCLQHTNWYFCKEDIGAFRVHGSAASAQNEQSGAGIYDRLKCFEQLITTVDGELKQAAVAARNRALTDMAKKYLARKKSGKRIPSKGSGYLKKFALTHPLLMVRTLVKAVMSS